MIACAVRAISTAAAFGRPKFATRSARLVLSRARLAQPVSESFTPPPIPEAQLRELQLAIAQSAVDRLIEGMKRPRALGSTTPGLEEATRRDDHTRIQSM
jgi:hypothetical protein